MDATSLTGFAAGLLTTIAFIPQVARIWKTKSAEDVSLAAFSVFAAGVGLWLVYGILKREPPIILWNGVTLVLAAAIVTMKVRYGRGR